MRHRDADLATDWRPHGAGIEPHHVSVVIMIISADSLYDLLPLDLEISTHHPGPGLQPLTDQSVLTHLATLITAIGAIL